MSGPAGSGPSVTDQTPLSPFAIASLAPVAIQSPVTLTSDALGALTRKVTRRSACGSGDRVVSAGWGGCARAPWGPCRGRSPAGRRVAPATASSRRVGWPARVRSRPAGRATATEAGRRVSSWDELRQWSPDVGGSYRTLVAVAFPERVR